MAPDTHNSPLYLSTALLVFVESPLSPRPPPSLLGNLLCKYALLTADGPFRLWRWKCNYRQQTSPLLSLEGATLILVPSALGGPLLIGISFEEGITNEAIWKPFVLGKEFERKCVCFNLCVYERQTGIMCFSKCSLSSCWVSLGFLLLQCCASSGGQLDHYTP